RRLVINTQDADAAVRLADRQLLAVRREGVAVGVAVVGKEVADVALADDLPVGDVPAADDGVGADGEELLAVGRELEGEGHPRVPLKGPGDLSLGGVKEPDLAVASAAGQGQAVRRPGQAAVG